MNETLEYALQKGDPSMAVPRDLYEALRRRNGRFADELYDVTQEGLLYVDRTSDAARLTIDIQALGQMEVDDTENDRMRRTVGIFEKVATFSDTSHPDPVLRGVRMDGTRLPGSQQFGMRARLLMPLKNDYHLQDVADWAMQTTARALSKTPDDRIETDVYSYVREGAGLSLKVNPHHGIRLETNESRYQFSDTNEQILEATDLYTHKAQLICLAGLIAIARA